MNRRLVALVVALLALLSVPVWLAGDGSDVGAEPKRMPLAGVPPDRTPGPPFRQTNFDATPRPVVPPTSLPGAVAALGVPGTPSVPCTDPRGCPDLFSVPAPGGGFSVAIVTCTFTTSGATCNPSGYGSWYNTYPPGCAVAEGFAQYGQNLLLAFDFIAGNRGPGDLIIGSPFEHPEWFDLNNCHGHPHFNEYADFRLWTTAGFQAWQELRIANPNALSADLLAAHPELSSHLTVSGKIGFCALDTMQLTIPGVPPGPSNFHDCSNDQGISVSWGDEYDKLLDGQWFDITNVPDGNYRIETEVNAERFFEETDYSNNFLNAPITLAFGSNRPPTRTSTTPSATPTTTASVTPSRTPTSAVTSTRSPTLTTVPTAPPTSTELTIAPTPSPSGTPTVTLTPSPTFTPSPPSTASPTSSTSPLATSTNSITATPSPSPSFSPTGSPTPSATATAMPGIGGRGLSVSRGSAGALGGRGATSGETPITLRWRDGTTEDGYLIARFAVGSGTLVILPPGGKLAAGATSFTDQGPFPESTYCYLVIPTAGAAALGLSDMICASQRAAAGTQVPGQFALSLDETTAALLTWTTTGAPDRYVLRVAPMNGAPAHDVPLPGGALMTVQATSGAPTCYTLFAFLGAEVRGNTETLCAVPNVQTLVTTSLISSSREA